MTIINGFTVGSGRILRSKARAKPLKLCKQLLANIWGVLKLKLLWVCRIQNRLLGMNGSNPSGSD